MGPDESNWLVHYKDKRSLLLPRKTEPCPPAPCTRYFVDTNKLNVEGVLHPVTEPEEYTMPEGLEPWSSYEIPTNNPEVIKNRREYQERMGRRTNRPSKERFIEELEANDLEEIAARYGVPLSTVKYWLRKYKLKATAQKEPKPEPIWEQITEPEPEQIQVEAEPEPEPAIAEHKSTENSEEVEQALNLISAVSSMANRRTFVRVEEFIANSLEHTQKDAQEASTTSAKVYALVRAEVLREVLGDVLQIIRGDASAGESESSNI